ncbi:adenylate kinase [Coralloluteibacterium stylophorae]|uniref:Adenylate kinase n=1 Tax=Coralloluteibacterium stylophorae TaxID=1776034 RepID=A0A8J7VT05_9GAMM|nr:adenylate kinase [Coralloluteibacterium stylophorae]MBS7457687.1 adenylate kinase [Coralloluteibacterium stylophorae]
MNIIGITGKARTGKDTLAEYLVSDHGYVRIGFADPIREFVAELTGFSVEQLMDSSLKEQPIDWLGGKSPRELMQTLGTEWGRQMVHEDLWLLVAHMRVRAARQAGAPGVVISDVRFDNEAQFVQELGGRVVGLTRAEAQSVSAHVSESGVAPELVSETFENDGPRYLLRQFADDLA